LGSRSNQRRRSRSGSRGSRSGSRGGRFASRGSRSVGVEEDAQHLGVPAPGGAPARRWISKAGNGEDRKRCTLPRLATNRLRSLTRGVEQQRAGRRGERGCAIAIYRREIFRRTSPSRARGSFTFPREPAPATPPTCGRRRNRPACAARRRAPGKRTLAVFPGSQAEAAFLASRSRAPSRARCANKAACSPGAQPGCWAGVANTNTPCISGPSRAGGSSHGTRRSTSCTYFVPCLILLCATNHLENILGANHTPCASLKF
jgi:hypothetical protein